jgi:hypothetical protein
MLVPAAVVAASCALGGFERVQDEPAQDGGPDVEVKACKNATQPSPPAVVDAGGDNVFTVALRKIFLIKGPNGTPLGYDIDRYCTCFGDQPSCIPPTDASTICDDDAGRDQASVAIFQSFNLVGLDLSSTYSTFAEQGRWSLLYTVKDYNGLPDDDHVRVEWFVAGSYSDNNPDNPGMTPPKWDGTDHWPVTPSSYVNGDPNAGVTFSDDFAYVTGGVLVATLKSGQVTLAGLKNRLDIRLKTSVVTARVVQRPDGKFTLREGMIAGRVTVSDMFYMMSSYRDDNGNPLCTGDFAFNAVRGLICNGTDIQADFAQPQLPCDALSFAIGFEADPAQIGQPIPIQPSGPGCPCATDPVHESCSPIPVDAGCPP